MLEKIKFKLKRCYNLLKWSPRKRVLLIVYTTVSIVLGVGACKGIMYVKTNPPAIFPVFNQKRQALVSQVIKLKEDIFKEPEIFRFDITSLEQYTVETLNYLTPDDLSNVKKEIERSTTLDPNLPKYPNTSPPPAKPPTKPPSDPPSEPPTKPPAEPPETPSKPPEAPIDPGKIAAGILKYINEERLKAGVPELSLNNALTKLALNHSSDMQNKGYFSHTSPEGITFPERLKNAGFLAGAENLYYAGRSGFPAKEPVDAWLGSSGHKRNMLYSGYSKVGIGVSGPYVTADFSN